MPSFPTKTGISGVLSIGPPGRNSDDTPALRHGSNSLHIQSVPAVPYSLGVSIPARKQDSSSVLNIPTHVLNIVFFSCPLKINAREFQFALSLEIVRGH